MAQEMTPELRKQSEESFFQLLGEIEERRTESIRAGITPSHIWLGPLESRALLVEINWQDREGRLRHTGKGMEAIIRGTVNGLSLMGLEVVEAPEPGVRVVETVILDKPRESQPWDMDSTLH